MRICPSCNTANEPDALFCVNCGAALPIETAAPPSPQPANVPASETGRAPAPQPADPAQPAAGQVPPALSQYTPAGPYRPDTAAYPVPPALARFMPPPAPEPPGRPPAAAGPAPGVYQYAGGAYVQASKDRSLALILEILPGFFGLLGIGWMYAGNVGVGVPLLIGMLLLDAMTICGGIAVAALIPIVGCLCLVPVPFVYLGALAYSAYSLNDYIKQHPETFGV